MARYENTKTSKKNKNKYYMTSIYPEVPESDNDMYYISQEGDRCDNLAFRFYGDSTLWWFHSIYISTASQFRTHS